MERNKIIANPSTTSPLKSIEAYGALLDAEYKVKKDALIMEFQDRDHNLVASKETRLAEYKFIRNLTIFNECKRQGKVAPDLIVAVERDLAALNYESIAASYSLQYWEKEFGDLTVAMIGDIFKYFIPQFQIKVNIDDAQITQLSIKLLLNQPHLRIKELAFVLNKALNGDYGLTYMHLGIDTILGWLRKFYEESAVALETRKEAVKPEGNRGGGTAWDIADSYRKQYIEEKIKRIEAIDKYQKANRPVDPERQEEINKRRLEAEEHYKGQK